jgi:hypothetical protein
VNVNRVLPFGQVSDFWNVVREVDPETVVREAHQPVRLVICGAPGTGKRTLAATLSMGATGAADAVVDVYDMPEDVAVALPSADLYLYVARHAPGPAERAHVQQLSRRPGSIVYVINHFANLGPGEVAEQREQTAGHLGLAPGRVLSVVATDRASIASSLGPGLIDAVPQLALPFGRQLPELRDAAGRHLIRETARVNAEFALMSSLPSFVPGLGTFAAAGADLVVLTKNQVMLLLKLAVLYQRPIDHRLQVLSEVAPVVGAAFLWRSAARFLISFVPSPLAIAPRGGVAFVGTYVVGRAAQYYYRWGQRPSPELLESFRREAFAQIETVAPLLARLGRRFGL